MGSASGPPDDRESPCEGCACDRTAGAPESGSAQHGQGLVEFALVLPIFVLVMMGVIEFGFLYNNILTVQYAARQGAKAAAEAGGVDGADCSILKAVEAALTSPIDKSQSPTSTSSSPT